MSRFGFHSRTATTTTKKKKGREFISYTAFLRFFGFLDEGIIVGNESARGEEKREGPRRVIGLTETGTVRNILTAFIFIAVHFFTFFFLLVFLVLLFTHVHFFFFFLFIFFFFFFC